jgi:membrane protein
MRKNLTQSIPLVTQIGKDLLKHIKDSQIFLVASSLAYTTILSIIPLLAVSFSIFKAFGGLDKNRDSIQNLIIQNLGENSGEQAMQTIQGFISNAHTGALGITGLIGLIVTSMSMLSSAENSINRVWNTPVSRPLFYRISSYWVFITLGPIAMSFALGFSTSTRMALPNFIPNGFGESILAIAFFFGVYKFTPNTNVNWRSALIASVFTSIALLIAKYGYGIYVQKFVSYDKIYGSLGAIPIFLLWVYILWIVILLGAAVSAVFQKRLSLS